MSASLDSGQLLMNKMRWDWSGKEATLDQVLAEVGKGWEGLVTELIEDLFEAGWDGNLVQIKEKFGQLRFYIGESNEKIDELISAAEIASRKICEICGEPGELRYDGWILALCDTHAKELNRK